MVFRGQNRFWTVNLTLETKLTTFQLCFLSLIVLRSLYLRVLAPLSQRLNVSYHNGWMSKFCRNGSYMTLINICLIILVRCITRSHGLVRFSKFDIFLFETTMPTVLIFGM